MFGEQQGMGATQATTGTGDDHDLVLKTDGFAHGLGSLAGWQCRECPAGVRRSQ
jgi:hypothetical protein